MRRAALLLAAVVAAAALMRRRIPAYVAPDYAEPDAEGDALPRRDPYVHAQLNGHDTEPVRPLDWIWD